MLKVLQIVVLSIAVAFFLALAGLAYYSSPPSTYPNKQQSAAQATEKQPNEKQHTFGGFINFLFPDAISIFTFWLVVATIILGVIAYAQIDFLKRAEGIATKTAQTAKDSVDVAKEALVSTNRAFISPKLISALAHRYDDTRDKFWYSISPIWENSGNTPTRDMTIYVNSYFESEPMPLNFLFPPFIGSEKTPVFAGPKASFGGSIIIKTGDELAEVKAGKKYFYMWGEARYRDIFADTPEYVTRFAYQITVLGDPTKPPSPDNVIQMTTNILSRHNCADEECKRQDRETEKTRRTNDPPKP